MSKKNLKALFSSGNDDWETPKDVYASLDKEFNFDFDPCPLKSRDDGLNMVWGNRNFVNPPYSKIALWIKKAYEEWLKGKTVVLLIPSRTDTRWFHDYILKADEIRFIKGRLKFSGHKCGAPFPSAVIVFRGKKKGLL